MQNSIDNIKLIDTLPRYPILELLLRKSGLDDKEIAFQIKMTPKYFRTCMNGTAKRGFHLGHMVEINRILGGEHSYDLLFMTRDKMLENPDLYVALERITSLPRGKQAGEAFVKAMEGLDAIAQIAAVEITMFFVRRYAVTKQGGKTNG